VTKIKYEILDGEKRQEEEDLRNENSKDRNRKARDTVTINVDDEHQFWPFTGEYWRDELGYYRYKLANKCGQSGSPENAPAPTEPEGSGDNAGEGAPAAPANPPTEGTVQPE
jgi:hypothetical protein